MKVLALLFALVVVPHDFFVSILTIRHAPATRTLDLTWRITAHDLEHALENVASLQLASEREHPKADSIITAYLHENIRITVNSEEVEWSWVGKELDGETLYCYLQVADVDAMKTITISNTLLHDLFYEQQNFVHVEFPGHSTQSHTFVLGAKAHTFTW